MRIGWRSWSAIMGLQLMVALPARAHPPAAHPASAPPVGRPTAAPKARDPVGAASAFAAALSRGDEATVKSLLAEDVVIYESGGQESSREEYASHHMKSDMAFLAGLAVKLVERKQGGNDDLAWVLTRSRIIGMYKGKAVDLHSTESLVLKRVSGVWRIVHIHWSSQPATTAAPATALP